MRLVLTSIALLLLARSGLSQSAIASSLAAEFPSSTFMDDLNKFRLWWKFIPANSQGNSQDMYSFAMEAETTGWVAMGISPSGTMPDADMIVGWVNGNATVEVEDRNSFGGKVQPAVDAQQNVNALGGGEYNGWTVVKFERAAHACEPMDRSIPVGTARVLWAFSPSNKDGPVLDYHQTGATNKGSRSINLAASGRPIPPLPPNTQSYDLLMAGASIPTATTSYICQLFQMPQMPEYYAVEFQPVIQPNLRGMVHHWILYGCHDNSSQPIPSAGVNASHLAPQVCHVHNMPQARSCRGGTQIAAWAIGGGAVRFPTGTGFPLGGNSPFKYAVMEVHYDNPQALVGLVDSGSGVRVVYANSGITQTASIMMIGVNPWRYGQWIPPNYPGLAWNKAQLPKECLASAMDAANVTEVKVLFTSLHMHLLGRNGIARHIRNGVELPYLDYNPNYDFNFQENIPSTATLKRGDSVQVECGYDSTGKTGMTFGGEGTGEEMCIVFLIVSPALSFGNLFSEWDWLTYNTEVTSATSSGLITSTYNANFQTYGIDTFDQTKPAALDFYNRIWNPAYRFFNCPNSVGVYYNNPTPPRPVSNYQDVRYFAVENITTPYVPPNVTAQCFTGVSIVTTTGQTIPPTNGAILSGGRLLGGLFVSSVLLWLA